MSESTPTCFEFSILLLSTPQVQCNAICPALTEIIDEFDLLVQLEVEVISRLLKAEVVKVRDFASPEERCNVAQNIIPEIFDPYWAVAEFEQNLGISSKAQASRGREPILGKIVQCLLDIRWISEEEVARRCTPMDIQALTEYKKKLAQDMRGGWGIYPWRVLRWDSVPTVQERVKLIAKYNLEKSVAKNIVKKDIVKERKESRFSSAHVEEEKILREIGQLVDGSMQRQLELNLVCPSDF